jgi:hypothetical protein
MGAIGEMTVEDAARAAAGNWMRFSCFCWDRLREIDDPDAWAIVCTHNRDSGLLDQSNANAILEALKSNSESASPDVVFESHSHWSVGWVARFSIRVHRCELITDAFRTYHSLMRRLDEYPILGIKFYTPGNRVRGIRGNSR